jgi:hypothetical protein
VRVAVAGEGSKGGGGGGQSSGKMAARSKIWRPTGEKCTNIYDTVSSQKFTKKFHATACSNSITSLTQACESPGPMIFFLYLGMQK